MPKAIFYLLKGDYRDLGFMDLRRVLGSAQGRELEDFGIEGSDTTCRGKRGVLGGV